jgi:translocation and assembly module TamB
VDARPASPPLRWRRAALTLAAIVAGLVLVGWIALVVITETDWGREQVRRRLVSFIEDQGTGRVSIGRVTGNLRQGISLHDVTITDSAGQPFIAAKEITAKYRLLSFLRKRVHLNDVLLVDPVVLLDRPPDGAWNYRRIFPGDTLPVQRDTAPGWGDWIRFVNLTVVNGHIVVRSPWRPSDDLTAAQRDSVVRDALRGGSRLAIIPADGGYQKVIELRELHGRLPVLQIADPALAARVIDVETLRTHALPFRPPSADIRDLTGRFEFSGDSIWWRGVDVDMPGSNFFGDGAYDFETGDMWIAAFGRPASFADLRWIYPRAPSRGGGPVDLLVKWEGSTQEYVFRNADMSVDGQRVAGNIGIIVTDTIAIRGADLRVANLDTRLLEQVIAGFEAPRSGIINGRIRADGSTHAMRVDADVAFADRLTGTSRVAAVGEIGLAGDEISDGIRARNLRLRLQPLRVELVRAYFPDLPVGGLITGSVALDGSTRTALAMQGELRHEDQGMVSQVGGRGTVRLGDELRFVGDLRLHPLDMDLVRAFAPDIPIGGVLTGNVSVEAEPGRVFAARGDVRHEDGESVSQLSGSGRLDLSGRVTRIAADLQLHPLDLGMLAAFAPEAGLRGAARGTMRLNGTTDDLRVATELTLHEGSWLAGEGRFALAGRATRYDFAANTRRLNLNAVLADAPSTSLTGTVMARGTGFDPATMSATVAADLRQLRIEDLALDSLVVRGTVADGLARIDRAIARGHDAVADVEGSFGLRADRRGELRYRLALNTLASLNPVVPGARDTGVVRPRSGFVAARLEAARRDSARIAAATEVERAATGARMPAVPVDTPRAIPRSALAGSLYAAGTLSGNIHNFDAQGRVAGENLLVRGHSARRLRGEFAWRNARSPNSALAAAVTADDLTVGGFAFDDLDGRVTYRSGSGDVQVAVRQGDDRDYSAGGNFILHADHNELHLLNAQLRFDTTAWRTTGPAAIRWGGRGLELVNLELRDQGTGRIYVDGVLPTEGVSNLRVAVTDFDMGHISDLLQSDTHVTGLVNLEALVQGTTRSPVMSGAASLTDGRWNDSEVPPLRGTFAYANQTLTTRFEALREDGATLATAEGDIPINLALADVSGSRFPERGMRLDITADSLPIDLLPQFTDALSDVSGTAMGRVRVTGRLDRPNLVGAVAIRDARGKVTATGIRVTGVNGFIRMIGDSVVVDSLVGHSDGQIRVSGGLAVGNWREPSFNLFMIAQDATILDNDTGRLKADAALALSGPINNAYVSGQMAIRTGVIYLPPSESKQPISAGDPALFNVLDTAVVRDRELLPETSPLMRNLRMDVDVTIDRTTWVRSRDANIEIFTDDRLQVGLQNEVFTIVGIVNSDRGEYQYLSRRFQVRRGSAIFIGAPEVNPTLQLTAEYEVRLPARPAINIRVVIGGTMRRPRVSLESDAQPPIPQSDILSYLAFGRESGSLLEFEGTALSAGGSGSPTLLGVSRFAAQRLATLAVGIGLQEAEFEWGRQLGVDVFNVRPADLPIDNLGEATFREFLLGTEIEIGKYINPYTFVATQGSLSALQGRSGPRAPPGIRLQHRTGHGWRFEPFIEPRFLAQEPSLSIQRPIGTSAFGLTVVREWRF